jgi:hypothetical protein
MDKHVIKKLLISSQVAFDVYLPNPFAGIYSNLCNTDMLFESCVMSRGTCFRRLIKTRKNYYKIQIGCMETQHVSRYSLYVHFLSYMAHLKGLPCRMIHVPASSGEQTGGPLCPIQNRRTKDPRQPWKSLSEEIICGLDSFPSLSFPPFCLLCPGRFAYNYCGKQIRGQNLKHWFIIAIAIIAIAIAIAIITIIAM